MHDSLCPRLTTTTDFTFQHSSFELVHVSVALRQRCLQLFSLYRPPPNKKNQLIDSVFFQEFPDLFEHCNTTKGRPLVVGDVNIYVDVPTNPLAVRLSALLDDFDLDKAVTFPTNQRGHTLYLVLHRRDDGVLQSTDADYTLDQSDHYCVVSPCLSSVSPASLALLCTLRPGNSAVVLATFKADLQVKFLASPQLSADQLHHFLQELLDQYALPPVTKAPSIINDSLHSGLFPSAFKSAVVKPLLKKTTLNPEIFKNYRPPSNLSFLSKILEKVVLRQLLNHLLTNNLFYSHQSAYRAVIAPRQPFSRSQMAFSLLSMKTKSLFAPKPSL